MRGGRLRPCLALVLWGSSIGCSVPFGSAADASFNRCARDEDCADTPDTSATCSNGICVATQPTNLPGLLLEIRPLAYAAFGANRSFVSPWGGASNLSLELQALLSLHSAEIVQPGCPLPDSAVPANVTLFPVFPFVGPSTDTIRATTQRSSPTDPYTFDVSVIQDTSYDVYVEPLAAPGCNGSDPSAATPGPPMFFPSQSYAPGATGVTRRAAAQSPKILTGEITDFGDPTMQWTVDVVEPKRGLPISVPLATPLTPDPTSLSVSFSLLVTWEDDAILRLSPVATGPELTLQPNEPIPRPTVDWVLEGAVSTTTTGEKSVQLSVYGLQTNAVQLSGTVYHSDQVTGANAQVYLQSVNLTGSVAHNATFALNSVSTDADGSFQVELPPGDYLAWASPAFAPPNTVADGGNALADGGTASSDGVGEAVTVHAGSTAGTPSASPLQLYLGTLTRIGGAVWTPSGRKMPDTSISITAFAAPPKTFSATILSSTTASTTVVSALPTATSTNGDWHFCSRR